MESIVEVEDLTYKIPFSDAILDRVNLKVREGEFVGILGRNGAGKSTLVDLIMGFRTSREGKIRVLNSTPTMMSIPDKEKVSYLSHDLQVKASLTVREYLEIFSSLYADFSSEFAEHNLSLLQLSQEARLATLSTGQLKQVQLIAALSTKPRLLVLDEITAVLDPLTRKKVFLLLQKSRDLFKTAIILATNIVTDLTDEVDKVYYLDHGLISECGRERLNELFKSEDSREGL